MSLDTPDSLARDFSAKLFTSEKQLEPMSDAVLPPSYSAATSEADMSDVSTYSECKATTIPAPEEENKGMTDVPVQISTLPDQRDIVAKKGAVFNLMVVGESGTGKTTFLNTLFADELLKRVGSRRRPFPFGGQEEESAYEYTGDESANSQHHRTTKIESATFDLEEEGVTVRFTVIDTPGFGNYVNNTNSWVPIVEYLDDQHRQYLVQEEQPERSRIRDVRVHVCVYFLKPGYRLMPLDIRAMKELSKRVNLIPVVSKADTFTIPEMEAFKANQDEFNADIKKIHRDVIDLEAAVDILSYRVRNDPKDTGGRISKGKANVADIFHRDR